MTDPTTNHVRHRHPTTRRGPGRFVTHFAFRDHRERTLVWHSRRNRKGLDPEPEARAGRSPPRRVLVIELTRITWWIGVLFMVGAALFATGSFGMWLEPRFPGAPVLFVGSLFFTSAAYLQFIEVINEPHPHTAVPPRLAFFRIETHKIGWWATLVQWIGTLLFNANTYAGMLTLTPLDAFSWVWLPNAGGSVCFLVASYLAYAEVAGSWIGWQPRNISWWIVVINLLGSIAFGVSAVAGFSSPVTGKSIDLALSDLTTFVGAVCFFVAAYLLIPEMTAHADAAPESPEALDAVG